MNSIVNLSDLLKNTHKQTIQCPTHAQQVEQVILGRSYGCPACNAEKIVNTANDELLAQQKTALLHSGIPPELFNKRLGNLKPVEQKHGALINRLVSYCQDIKTANTAKGAKNIILLGDTGTGKTTMAGLVAKGVLSMAYALNEHSEIKHNDRLAVKFVTGASIKADITFSWTNEATRHEQEIVRELCQVPVLVIDEVGVGDGFSRIQDIYSVIIDGRHKNKLPTIITSNLDRVQLKQHMGERVEDRLFSDAIYANCAWTSFRKLNQDLETF